jgi:hypothetical protein
MQFAESFVSTSKIFVHIVRSVSSDVMALQSLTTQNGYSEENGLNFCVICGKKFSDNNAQKLLQRAWHKSAFKTHCSTM